MTVRIGSLFSGAGGLDLGVQAALGGEVIWHSEIDPNVSKILAHHWPDVPNLGDITKIDWADVPPVDVLTGGFPCQPVSLAGERKGTKDERWLFDDILTAIRNLDPQPRLCVFENVRGLLTANGGEAMARVVEGLASVGYMGTYGILSAAAVGAPHRRERVFIVAHPRDDRRENSITRGLVSELPAAESDHIPLPDAHRHGPHTEGIARWANIMGRPPPEPVELGPSGRPLLNPQFSEWLMGLPAGHVTATGISRVAQLTALGNGVVPQQAAAAIRLLLERIEP